MVPYNKDKQIHGPLSQWTGSGVAASVILDQPGNVAYTNLDEVTGKVRLRLGKSADITAIVVKLEGESRTRLLSPGGGADNERPRARLEYHKILYRVQTVFPSEDLIRSRGQFGRGSYTLPAGQHEYPFRFKLPFNNACLAEKHTTPSIGVTGSGLEIAQPPTRHVKKTLPPTLSGFPGEAEIRYFVKVTVSRSSIFKENPRGYTSFNFFPIEPPRPPHSSSEIFARQRHVFDAASNGDAPRSKMKGIFGMKKDAAASSNASSPPSISVDVRLPDPAILTCNSELPLRIIVKKLSGSNAPVYLQSLQISLLGYTKIRAHEVYRTESNSWVIMSRSNMGLAIGSASDPVGKETVIDESYWRGQTLPNTVAPSFITCNISRDYQIDVRVGLSCGSNSQKPQSIILPLRLDAQVFSGIRPPPQLLAAMAEARAGLQPSQSSTLPPDKPQLDHRTEAQSQFGAGQVPPTPVDVSGPSGADSLPPRQGNAGDQPPLYSDAPPSYEDAIATNLPPIDAARPEYVPPAAGEDAVLSGDEKRGWV